MNKVILIGRLTKAPEHKTTQSGTSVATLSVAVEKGQQVAVTGELQTRSWEANDGSKRYVTEIQAQEIEFLAKPGTGNGKAGSFSGMDEVMDDGELPF